MKKILLALIVTTIFGIFLLNNVSALTLAVNDENYVGSFSPAHPASEAAEVVYINHLRGLATNSIDAFDGVTGQTYNRLGSFLTGLPEAETADSDREESEDAGFDNVFDASFMYIVGKYGSHNDGALVWYLGNYTGVDETVTLPEKFNPDGSGAGLSHISGFNSIPEPAGMFLLGTGLIGLAALGRKKFKK